MSILKKNRFEILFAALLVKMTYPFIALLLLAPIEIVRFLSFIFLVLASFNLGVRRIHRLAIICFGGLSALGLACHLIFDDPAIAEYVRIYTTCFFYITLIYILTRSFLISKNVNLKVVIGAISGYLLIGYLGSITIQMMEFHHQGSFTFSDTDSFDYIYFSFISMLTVGYGDIIPTTPSAKSLIILISLAGQLYMAVGIASFVGKFMNK